MKRQHPTDTNLFWCPKCETYKARGEFAYSSVNFNNIRSQCRECSKVLNAKRYIRKTNRPLNRKHPTIDGLFWCGKCKEYKKRDEFGKDKSSIHGIQAICTTCRVVHEGTKECVYCGNLFLPKKMGGHAIRCPDCRKYGINDNKKKYQVNIRKNLSVSYLRQITRITGEKDLNGVRERISKKRSYRDVPQRVRPRIMLWDQYIKKQLKMSGYDGEEITAETIELKRQQIIMKRTLKQFKQWRKENESNHTDVSGIEHADEADHEGRL